MWFQQDGATCHSTRANLALLQETFPGRVISRRGDIKCPPRSYNLTPLDFFGRATRNTVFMQINIQLLKTNFRQIMAEIPPNMFPKVYENYLKRINLYNTSRGAHLNDVVFHI